MLITFLTNSVTQTDQIIGLSLLLIGISLTAVTSFLWWWLKQKNRHNTFKTYHQESTYWGFITKNFPLFLLLFFIIMSIVGATMIIK